jgi:FO synthase
VLEDAGRCSVPFTTGILIGIGETRAERAESLFAIRQISREYGGIQEVIVQNFRAKPDTKMRGVPDAELADLAATIRAVAAGARPGRAGQPREPHRRPYGLILAAGIDDWGGVSPLTPITSAQAAVAEIELAARTRAARMRLANASRSTPDTCASRGWTRGWRARVGDRRPGTGLARRRDPARPALASPTAAGARLPAARTCM